MPESPVALGFFRIYDKNREPMIDTIVGSLFETNGNICSKTRDKATVFTLSIT